MKGDADVLMRLRHPAVFWVLWGFGLLWLFRTTVLPTQARFVTIEQQKAVEIQKREVLRRVISLETQTAPYGDRLSEGQSVYTLIKEIDQKARETGISLSSAIPLGSETVLGLKRTTLRLEALGNYHELGRFVSKLENSQVLVRIDSVYMERIVSGINKVPGLKVTLELSAFSKAG